MSWSAAAVNLYCHVHLHLFDQSGRNGAHRYDPRFKVGVYDLLMGELRVTNMDLYSFSPVADPGFL